MADQAPKTDFMHRKIPTFKFSTDEAKRDRLVTSRLEMLWEYALHWPAKYRNAIEACLDVDEDFNRAALQRTVMDKE